MEQTYLNLLCNYLLGKAVQTQLCSLSLLGDWSQLLFYCQHLLTPHLQSTSPSKSHVPLPCQVWVTWLGG